MTDRTSLAPRPGESPFDQIRQRRPDGAEFWSARELQPFMGYSKWQDFQTAIERAKAAAANAGHDADSLFVQVIQLMDAGNLGPQRRVDYELTRFACYLTFLNGDPRKPEVAAAQAYFAIRTREAETRPASAALPDRRALAQMVIEAEDARVLAEAKVAELAPAAAAWESLADAEGDYSLREAAQILSRDPAISTGQNRLAKSLRELGLLDRRGEPYQHHIQHVRRRPTAYTHPHTGEPKLSSQLRVTVSGVKHLHGKLGGARPLRLDVATASGVRA